MVSIQIQKHTHNILHGMCLIHGLRSVRMFSVYFGYLEYLELSKFTELLECLLDAFYELLSYIGDIQTLVKHTACLIDNVCITMIDV